MKRERTSKPLAFSKEQIAAALAAAPERADDPECPYDPNDAKAVAEFWASISKAQKWRLLASSGAILKEKFKENRAVYLVHQAGGAMFFV